MKSIAEFKRRIKPGQTWHAFHHPMKKDMGLRKIKRVTSNAFTFETPRGESWCYMPKARDVKFLDGDIVEFYEGPTLVLTYRLVGE